MAYIILASAILAEVFGSTMLKLSEGFQRKVPVLGVIAGFGLAFYLLSLALLDLPVGLSYAIWSGAGTILTVGIGVFVFKVRLGKHRIYGSAFLMRGMVVLDMYEGRALSDESIFIFNIGHSL